LRRRRRRRRKRRRRKDEDDEEEEEKEEEIEEESARTKTIITHLNLTPKVMMPWSKASARQSKVDSGMCCHSFTCYPHCCRPLLWPYI
jgi:hypothetical protein